jgi:UDP-N-acetylglucosamine:LPS N-acetylglucosamine transferase
MEMMFIINILSFLSYGAKKNQFSDRPAAPKPVQVKVLVVASGGGHWVQMRRIMPAFEGLEIVYASVEASSPEMPGRTYYPIHNVSRRDRFGFAVLLCQLARILLRERPDVVITTGAAPGFLALLAAKGLLGCRTIWIDSIANAERMSSSGAQARRVADVWLTQWEHLAKPGGPDYWGAVL